MHTQVPSKETEARDQREFDEAVKRNGKVVLGAVAALALFAAVLMSALALVQSGQRSEGTTVQAAATQSAAVAQTAPAAAPVDVKIVGSYKTGPDHKQHDAFTKTEFAVKVGQPLQLRIDNTDDVPHSITAPAVGVNIVAKPGVHTYTLLVNRAGKFQWYCMWPCDSDTNGWAMQHPGFMSGYITAT